MKVSPAPIRTALCLAPLLLLSLACRTQLWPGPMQNATEPLPKGVDADTPAGLVEVLVYRHADPVQVRLPESPTAFPLTFFRKSRRMNSGAWVHCGAGGRAEVLWPTDGATVVMFDNGICRVGEPTRGEPAIRFENLTRVELSLAPGAITELPGGSRLTGSPDSKAGPYLIERVYDELIRIFNQSGTPAYLRFREEEIVIGPGERIDLPLLEAGGAPIDLGGAPRSIAGGRIGGQLYGNLDVSSEDGGMRIRSLDGSGIVLSQGLAIWLRGEDSAVLTDLGEPEPPRFDPRANR